MAAITHTRRNHHLEAVLGLILAAIAVGTLIGYTTYTRHQINHTAWCQQYRDALTLAYTTDPGIPITTSGLSAADAAQVVKNQQVYRAALTAPTNAPDGITTSDLTSQYAAFIAQEIPRVLARHNC